MYWSPYRSPNLYFHIFDIMKISLLHKSFKDNKKESPLFVRVRGKTSNGVFTSSLISAGVNILPKNFSSGTIKTSTPNYTHKQKIVNTILNDLEQIVSNIKENGLEPNPQLVKKEYENKSKVDKRQKVFSLSDEFRSVLKNTKIKS